jgi:signal transduction histidine kinase
MTQIGKRQTVPVEVWDVDALASHVELQPNVPLLLRALANETRLDLLRLLAAGRAEAGGLSQELRLPVPVVRRHLRALAKVGLVRAEPRAGIEVYQLAQHAIRLLNATLVYSLGDGTLSPRPNGRLASPRVPAPPLACTLCDNRGFVEGVLGELGTALGDARQYHSRIKTMSSQILTAHEAERKRIARELHDDTAQALTSILVRLRLLERSTIDDEVLRNVEELRELTGGALDSVRRMAMDLRPAALDDLGLVPALQAYAEKYSQSWSVGVTINVEGLNRRLPADVELVLYRVVQEALTNIAKHAFANSAMVSLSRRHNEVTLTVEDNGVGFDLNKGPRTNGSGLGLFGMRERLALIGGDVQVESARGTGTRITARVPLTRTPGKTRRAT